MTVGTDGGSLPIHCRETVSWSGQDDGLRSHNEKNMSDIMSTCSKQMYTLLLFFVALYFKIIITLNYHKKEIGRIKY